MERDHAAEIAGRHVSAFAGGLAILQHLSFLTLIAVSAAVFTLTVLAGFEVLPWVEFELGFGDSTLPQAGMIAQIAVTGFLIGLCFFLPSHRRIMSLERSHRRFEISMEDIARAYHVSHAQDRAENFVLSEEFSAMKERIQHLRDHPDLGHLEPEILEVAAQMSHQSRDLAKVYSDKKLRRARAFLQQRQEEVDQQVELIAMAKSTCDELKRWQQDIAADEREVNRQLARLESDLLDILPSIGFDLAFEDENVVQLPAIGTEEPDGKPIKVN